MKIERMHAFMPIKACNYKQKAPHQSNEAAKLSSSKVNFGWGSYDEFLKYKAQLTEKYFPNRKLDSEIVDFLDNVKLSVDNNAGGEKQEKTIRKIIEDSVIRTFFIDGDLYHSTYVVEDAQNIINNGFDPFKISRTKVGPGFYFSSSEGEARMFNSCVLKGNIKGPCAVLEKGYYDKISCPELYEKLKQYLGLDEAYDFAFLGMQGDIVSQIINEYTRNTIIDLGYDVTFSACDAGSYCVVHNQDAISGLNIFR